MAGQFDPYHKWLGVPPEEQPPNHYRLLGLTRFESDPDAIEAAAEGRMALLRSRQNGPHSADSQRLLSEVASAQRCLLDPQSKTAYDAQLRADSLQTPTAPLGPVAAQPVSPQPTGPQPVGPQPAGSPSAGPPQTAPPRSMPPRSGSPASQPAADPPAPQTAQPLAASPQTLPQSPLPDQNSPLSTPLAASASPAKRRRKVKSLLLSPALIGILIAGLLLAGAIYYLTRTPGESVDGDNPNGGGQVAGGGDAASNGSSEGDQDAEQDGDARTTKGSDGNGATTGDGASNDAATGNSTGDSTGDSNGAGGAATGNAGGATAANSTSETDAELTSTIWTVLRDAKVESSVGDSVEQLVDHSFFLRPAEDKPRRISLEATSPIDQVRWVRIEAIPDPRLPKNGPGWNHDGNFIISEVHVRTMPPGFSDWKALLLSEPESDFDQETMPATATLDRAPLSGWGIHPQVGQRHQIIFRLPEPLSSGTPLRVEMDYARRGRFGFTGWLGRFRVSVSNSMQRPPLATPPVQAASDGSDPEDPSTSGVGPADASTSSENAAKPPPPDSSAVDTARVTIRRQIPPPSDPTPVNLLNWASQLIEASKTEQDPVVVYALLSEAERTATLACDARLVFDSLDRVNARFEIDLLARRTGALRAMAERVQSPLELDSLLLASDGVASDLFLDARYASAADLLDDAYAAFQRSDSGWHVEMTSELRKFARRLARAEQLNREAEATLSSDPEDADANAVRGLWLAVYQNQLEAGLEHYRRGSDSVWKKLADAEAAPSPTAKSLGDLWFTVGQREDKEVQAAMHRRAAYWYEQALTQSQSAVEKKQMQQRLDAIRLLPNYAVWKPEAASLAVGDVADLLPLVQLPADTLTGFWARDHETLLAPASSGQSRLKLPVEVGGDYLLDVHFTTKSGGGVLLALPAADRQFQLLLGAGGVSGIQYVGGRGIPANRIVTPARLSRGKRHSLLVRFATESGRGRIEVRLDKQPYLAWEGELTSLNDPDDLSGGPRRLTLGALPNSEVHFHSARLRPLSLPIEQPRTDSPFR